MKNSNSSPTMKSPLSCAIITTLILIIGAMAPFTLAYGLEGSSPNPTTDSKIENAVVKIFATKSNPDPFKPWSKQAPQEVTGSGVVIEGKRILTNAHVVLYASQVRVQANQGSEKISATVEVVAPGIDLAVLKLEDEKFFNNRPPLKRAHTLPEVKDVVMAYGFPMGGSSLSITKGIVSRIEFTRYHYPVSGLRIQIDAAINPGNSGGPAIVDGKMIGIAFSHLGKAQNIGYIIPCEEVEIFLRDIADGVYDGKPALFEELQTLENPALRTFLKLDKKVAGIVVHEPLDIGVTYPLKKWDVIIRIGDNIVDNTGMVSLNKNIRVHFQYFIQKIAKKGRVPLTVVRGGKTLPVEVPVAVTRPLLIPSLNGAYPSFFVYGPLVFSKASLEFVGRFISSQSNLFAALSIAGSPLATRLGDTPAFDGEELVIVSSPSFPHKLVKGYSNLGGKVVRTVNDTAIKNLKHLVEVLRDSKTDFIKIDFAGRYSETTIFPRKDMVNATEEILTDNGIRSKGSPDTLAVWNSKPSQ
jgi:S1-C subfamily serine protease